MSAFENEDVVRLNDDNKDAAQSESQTKSGEFSRQAEKSVFNELTLNRSLLEQYKRAVDISSIVSKTDPYGSITFVNDQFCRISGYCREELIGATHRLIRHPDNSELLFQDMWQTIRARKVWQGVIKNRRKDGTTYYVDSVIVPLFDPSGEISEFMSIRTDVTDLIEQQSLIERQFTDPLTGLPNRQKLTADLDANSERSFLLIDVSDFSEINEYHGYTVGDQILKALAVMMQRLISQDATLYHLGGDIFGVLTSQRLDVNQVTFLCNELSRRISSYPVVIEDQQFPLSVVIGAGSGASAFIEADIALHSAQEKQLAFEVYGQGSRLKKRIEDNISWVGRIRDAIRHDRIEVFAQPIISTRSGEIEKCECLMRLRDEDGELHSPYAFLEAAKRARLYDSLTRIVIYKAFQHFSTRTEDFSINLTARDILNTETVDTLLRKAQMYGLADRLIIEIVESEGIENYTQVSQFIARAKEAGCRIAVDDFGSGYSNFEYLLKLDIDFIKVDGSLIRHLDTDANTRMLSEMIVSFGQKVGAETVAEFVHSEAVKQAAEAIGFDYLQGFHTGKPKPLV